ncbi:MAG: DnaB-like helicase C-terminal domain-containing protein [Actinomycetota bacterium]
MLGLNRRVSAPRSIGELLGELRDEVASAWARDLIPVPTKFRPLDDMTGGGLRAGELTLIGGVPGAGKTNVTLQWARTVAAQGVPALYCCFEHDESTLLTRLLAMELGEIPHEGYDDRIEQLRDRLSDVARGRASMTDVLTSDRLMSEAYERMQEYASDLYLVRCSGARTDLIALDAIVQSRRNGRAVLFVDYLQKVSGWHDVPEHVRVQRVVEGLKDLALEEAIPVVSVVAGDMDGIESKRLRPHHLSGSAALVYECDVLILLNDKFNCVSKNHLAYDLTKAQTFRDYTVFTIEKNRGGPAPVDLEFRKEFQYFRFNPRGSVVSEKLIDDRLVTD